jgi:signal transduction histidine kinase
MPPDSRFPALVSIACHDLRAPLAVVYGFTSTLARADLEPPADRYVEMIGAASEQLDELLDLLSIATRIEAGRYAPDLHEIDSLALSQEAAAALDEGRVRVTGEGALLRLDVKPTRRALTHLARAAVRHGGLDSVDLLVRGPELELSPITRTSTPVLLGEDLREFGAPAAGVLIHALGGSVEARGDRLHIVLPAASAQD